MNILNKEYWRTFIDIDEEGIERGNGVAFEDLIELLLMAIYEKEWHRTKKSHDDNRDFWIHLEEQKIWAECKNYKDPIAMSVLAPTLVMAQIYDINEILFFSRSCINRFAKDKIMAYGEKSHKKIVFYDGIRLENLIWHYRLILPDKFSPKDYLVKIEDKVFPFEQYLQIYFFQNAVSNVQSVAESFQIYTEAKSIRYNETFALTFCLENPFQDSNAEITIEFLNDNNDRYFFQYFCHDIKPEKKQWFKTLLNKGEGRAITLNMRQIRFKPNIDLPRFRVTACSKNDPPLEWTSQAVSVTSSWIGKTRLIGSDYLNIINKTEQILINNPNISTMLITGSSGTGKTRMLEECQTVFLKNGYQIINFSGQKDYSSYYFFKEIISFLYEIPSNDVLELMEQHLLSEETKQINASSIKKVRALQLLKEIIDNHTEENLRKILDKYADILYEKISKSKNVLIIDNMQFAGNAFQHFIEQYIYYGINQQKVNHSVLLLVFNLDYMTSQSSELVYNILHADIRHLLPITLKGFNNEEKGIEFLQELTRTNKDDNIEFYKKIIEKVSLKPYNLFQTVKYLEEMDIIKISPNEQGYIVSNPNQYNVLSNIYSGIIDVLDKRFEFLSKTISYERLLFICSVVYVFDSINLHKKKIFNIQQSELKYLCEKNILCEYEGIYSFDHDIIRNYFYQSYRDHILYSLEWIQQRKAEKQIRRYPIPYLLYKISIEKDRNRIIDTANGLFEIDIPERIASLFFNKLLDAFSDILESGDYKGIYIQYIHQICVYIRQYDGSEKAWHEAKAAYDTIQVCCPDALSDNAKYYRPFIHFCCDIAVQLHFYDEEREFIKNVLNACTKANPKDVDNRDEIYVLQAIMYNRWYISYNTESNKEEIINQRQFLMTKSREFIPKIFHSQKRGLIEYLNNSDEGYNFYGYQKDKKILMDIWNYCISDIPKLVPEKTLNYYRKKIQYALIDHDKEAIDEEIKNAMIYLESGEYSHEPIIFGTFFQMAKVMSNLQHSPKETYLYNVRIIDNILKLQHLLNNHKLGDILLLKGVNAHYSGKKDDVYYSYKEAYEYYISGETSRYWIKKSLLEENVLYSFSVLGIYESGFDVSFFSEKCRKPLTNSELKTFKASGIQRTGDLCLNLPLI